MLLFDEFFRSSNLSWDRILVLAWRYCWETSSGLELFIGSVPLRGR